MLQGWHRGERAIQKKLGFDGTMRMAYIWIDGEMPEEHRIFHTTRLPFIPVTTLDEEGRPWSCIFAGVSGKPGFVTSSRWDSMDMVIKTWPGDPFRNNVRLFGRKNKMLAAGIGIEFSTRRRNKFAGHISSVHQDGDIYKLNLIVNQAIGNCPKYINVRDLVPHPDTRPVVEHHVSHLGPSDRLPEELSSLIIQADTVFIGSTYQATKQDEAKFPSHVGQNQRGGRTGFIRVRPSDGKTIVLPDYSGNRLLTSLGNIEATPLASLTFVDFLTGDILYVTGNARTLVGSEAQELMPRQNVLTCISITGYTFVRDALPVRQRSSSEVERSPYSPPVRRLAEEKATGTGAFSDDSVKASLSSIVIHSADLATFTFNTSNPVHILPGQTAILDFTPLLGKQKYQHMAAWKPSSVNDDRIRTWTVSSAHLGPEGTSSFALTMREKPGGAVTGALFSIARKLQEMRPELLQDTRPLEMTVGLVGIAGDFKLPITLRSNAPESKEPDVDADTQARSVTAAPPMLWFAGGIGITPFLSMLGAIVQSGATRTAWDITLALSTREPGILTHLIANALGRSQIDGPNLRLQVDVFSSKPIPPLPPITGLGSGMDVTFAAHEGRISQQFIESCKDIGGKTAYVCGPEDFERGVIDLLRQNGYNKTVVRESFEY
ncbi:hypothetical protein EIP86_006597 [Pleurotus ostreatoroseus]|nr:hypothetical protein EIP86_006597 [Pleurotus ostreatoroseus]